MTYHNSVRFNPLIMYSPVVLFFVGLLGLSMGLPIEDTHDFAQRDEPGRIVGGWDAPEAYAPHMVALVIGSRVRSLICGAILVTRWHVVTAAHCAETLESWEDGHLMPTTRGQIGSNFLSKGYDVIQFSKHLNHPEYDRVNVKNDISVLWMSEELPKNSRAQPIALSFKKFGGGVPLTVTGWGKLSDDVIVVNSTRPEKASAMPDRLQKLQVLSLSHDECKKGMQEAGYEVGHAPEVVDDVELCTMHPLGAGQGMCNGDSGSALWTEIPKRGGNCKNDNCVKRVVVGLVSWGFPCARGFPDVHARMSGFQEFMVSTLELSEGAYEE